MPQGIIRPENQVISQPGYVFTREYTVDEDAEVDDMKPSAVVIVGDEDYTVIQAGLSTDLVLGILDVGGGKRIEDPADPALVGDEDYKDFHYLHGEAVRVIEGECDCVVILAARGVVVPGTAVVPAAGGEVTNGAVGTVLGWALETLDDEIFPQRLLIHYVPWRNSHAG